MSQTHTASNIILENDDDQVVQVGLTRNLVRNSDINFDILKVQSQKNAVSKSYKFDKRRQFDTFSKES